MAAGAQQSAGATPVGRDSVFTVRRTGVCQQFYLGVAERTFRRARRGDPDNEPVQIPADLPAGGRHPAQSRPLTRRVCPHPGAESLGSIFPRHPTAALAFAAGGIATDCPAHVGGIRCTVDHWPANLHHRDLPTVRAGIQQRQRRDALGGVAGTVLDVAVAGTARSRQRPACTYRPGRGATGRTGQIGPLDDGWAALLPVAGDHRQRHSSGNAGVLAGRGLVGGIPDRRDQRGAAFLPGPVLGRRGVLSAAGVAGGVAGGAL